MCLYDTILLSRKRLIDILVILIGIKGNKRKLALLRNSRIYGDLFVENCGK